MDLKSCVLKLIVTVRNVTVNQIVCNLALIYRIWISGGII